MKIKYLSVGLRDGAYIGDTVLYDLEDIKNFYLENDGTLVINEKNETVTKYTRKQYVNMSVQ